MIEIFFIFLCVLVIVLIFENEQLDIQLEISRKCSYCGKDSLWRDVFCPKAGN